MKSKLLLKPGNIKSSFDNWKVKGIFNPAAIRLKNKKIMLIARVAEKPIEDKSEISCPYISTSITDLRVEKIKNSDVMKKFQNGIILKDGTCRLTTISHLKPVILDESGFNVEKITNDVFTGTPKEGQYGVEDSHVIKLRKKYIMTYVTVSINEGVCTSLAISKDLKKWKRKGIIFREQNKDVVIFPEKIKNKYVALHRPEGGFEFSKPSIWISHSKDLIYWGKEKSIIRVRENAWDDLRIGAGCIPVKTKEGWLVIYHGVTNKNEKKLYQGGALLLDLKNPEKILARSPKNKPLIKPEEKYEKKGFMNNVVFPTGIVKDLNNKDLLIYSGGGDEVISVKKIGIKKILNHMEFKWKH